MIGPHVHMGPIKTGKFTCSQIMDLPEHENVPIEDWHKQEHIPGCQVCQNADWVPQRAVELQTRVCIEVRLVVSGDRTQQNDKIERERGIL